ncbi:MAG: site-specific integrase [Roseovarius sp.]|uniref:tyrosine-type recombinase/integrase n=1 Tax=Roseovarius sp. TaxID=1486281 RepID=UPI0032ED2C6A
MPQHAKGPRLYRRKDTGIYIIRDTGRGERSTGTRDSREAEKILAQYVHDKDRHGGPATSSEMTVAEALNIYASEHAPHVADPARIAYALDPLISFWAELPISAIRRETCRAYAKQRVKVLKRDPATRQPTETEPIGAGTIRRELGALSAALAYCREEGRLVDPPKVHLPPKPEPKDRWLTRQEAARLLWAAWRNPNAKHLAKFILVALYTGTRKSAILRLRFMPNTSGGHVDLERSVMYRIGSSQARTKKQQPEIRITPRLLAHLRRWRINGSRFVVDFRGQGVGSIKRTWATTVREAGLEGTGVVPHSLRHTAITWSMQAGTDIYQAAGYFGVSIETMFKVYAHHHPDHQQEAVAAAGRGGRKL